jgi:hypothetical protein
VCPHQEPDPHQLRSIAEPQVGQPVGTKATADSVTACVISAFAIARAQAGVSSAADTFFRIRHLVAYPPDTRNLTTGAGDVLIRLVPVALAGSLAGFR